MGGRGAGRLLRFTRSELNRSPRRMGNEGLPQWVVACLSSGNILRHSVTTRFAVVDRQWRLCVGLAGETFDGGRAGHLRGSGLLDSAIALRRHIDLAGAMGRDRIRMHICRVEGSADSGESPVIPTTFALVCRRRRDVLVFDEVRLADGVGGGLSRVGRRRCF